MPHIFRELSKEEKIEILKHALQLIIKGDNPKNEFICTSIHGLGYSIEASDLMNLAQRYSHQHLFDPDWYEAGLERIRKFHLKHYDGPLWDRGDTKKRIHFLDTLITKMEK